MKSYVTIKDLKLLTQLKAPITHLHKEIFEEPWDSFANALCISLYLVHALWKILPQWFLVFLHTSHKYRFSGVQVSRNSSVSYSMKCDS